MSESDLNIAVVEDNDTLRDLLVSFLSVPGRTVFGVDCGEDLNALLHKHRIDIMVLDVNLPHEDGFSIAQRIRKSLPEVKIVMLTARVRPADRASAYLLGVDVFLTKPTTAQELDAVIQNLSRKDRQPADLGLILIREVKLLKIGQGPKVALSESEAFFLEQLVLAPSQELHVETLLENFRAHGMHDFSRENLTVMVSRLRTKLHDGRAGEVIKAVRGFGYRLIVPITLA